MVPFKGEWTPFKDFDDQLNHYRAWGLVPPKSKKLRPTMVVDGYFGIPEPCNVVGYDAYNWAVIQLDDGYHLIHGEYLAEMQPSACQRLPVGTCFPEILSKYVVLDIETTGFNSHFDRIIEIAVATYEYGKKLSELTTLVNPEVLIPAEIVSLTGITQDMADDAPYLEYIKDQLLEFIGDLPIIGHNAASFDIPFLTAQLGQEIDNPVIDTLPLARNAFPNLPRHKLEYLNQVLHLGSTTVHRALDDVTTTNALLWACLAPRRYERLVNKSFLDTRVNGTATKKKKSPSRKENVQTKRKFEKVDIKSIAPSCDCVDASSPLCGKLIVFTGTLSIPRETAMQLAVDAGAILKNTVSRKTDYLVVGQQDIAIVGMDGMSSKEEKAHELNDAGKATISIISEEEFIELAHKEAATV